MRTYPGWSLHRHLSYMQQRLQNGFVEEHRYLGDNFHLHLQKNGPFWRLSMVRLGGQANETERAEARKALKIPAWVTYFKHYEFNYVRGWGILRITWAETEMQMLEFQPGMFKEVNQ